MLYLHRGTITTHYRVTIRDLNNYHFLKLRLISSPSLMGNLCRVWLVYIGPLVFTHNKVVCIIWLSNILILSVSN